MSKVKIAIEINGEMYQLEVGPVEKLLDLLRDRLHLTGTKYGCGAGECGACSVLLDGRVVDSCLVLAAQADGCQVTTVEGLSGTDGELGPLQRAFVEAGGIQCGFCTPGMLMSAHALLLANPEPGEADIREALAGNLCRCTGYTKIVAAILMAAPAYRNGGGAC